MQVGLPTDHAGARFEQHFAIGPLGERWLPAAYKPVAISLADTLVVRSSDTIVTDADDVSHLRYQVVSDAAGGRRHRIRRAAAQRP